MIRRKVSSGFVPRIEIRKCNIMRVIFPISIITKAYKLGYTRPTAPVASRALVLKNNG